MVPFRVEREVTVRSVLVCVRTELAEQAVSNAAAQLGLSDIITTAVSGADALARVAEQPADVLLVDTASVRPDTVGFTRQVLERSPSSVVVFLGPEDPAVARGAVDAGARGLIRGGEREDLVATVAKALMLLMRGRMVPGQPVPRCNCGLAGDLESIASLSGIARNLLPFWLTRYPGHPLAGIDPDIAAKQTRDYGERGDELAGRIFDQQATAIGRMFTIASNVLDPDAYFVGGGVTDTGAEFRTAFLERVRKATQLRVEQASVATFAIVPDLDMAGARGSALAALRAIRPAIL